MCECEDVLQGGVIYAAAGDVQMIVHRSVVACLNIASFALINVEPRTAGGRNTTTRNVHKWADIPHAISWLICVCVIPRSDRLAPLSNLDLYPTVELATAVLAAMLIKELLFVSPRKLSRIHTICWLIWSVSILVCEPDNQHRCLWYHTELVGFSKQFQIFCILTKPIWILYL